MYMYVHGRNRPIFLVTNLIVILQWGNKGEEGEGEVEVEIIHMCIYVHVYSGYYLSEC